MDYFHILFPRLGLYHYYDVLILSFNLLKGHAHILSALLILQRGREVFGYC